MLILTRKPGEKIMVGDDIVISILDVKGSNVRVGIDAPREIAVYRDELLNTVKPNRAPHAGRPEAH